MTAAAGARRQWYLPGAGARVVLAAVGVGLLDTASLLALTRGMVAQQGARVALLAPLYGAYPVVTILLTLVVLRERLAANQWLGVALVLAGTALLAV
jgi:uncharacterized membrane protein